MTFVPPTPEAKVNIRHGATAADLGWSQQFYERFCWQYGLTPVKKLSVASLLTEVASESRPPVETAAALASTGDPFRDAVLGRWRRGERRLLTIEFAAGNEGAVRRTIEVARHEAATMIVLSRCCHEDGWTTGEDVAKYCGRSNTGSMKTQISHSYWKLRNLLASSPLDIQSVKGTGSRIVFATTKQWARVRLVRLGEIEIE